MKCPKCQRNQRRGREGMTCKSCSYHFVFDPKEDKLSGTQKLHDSLFLKIISHASASGTYRFTPNQLFSSARHFVKKGVVAFAFLLALGIALTWIMWKFGFVPGVIFGCLFSAIFLFGLVSRIIGNYGTDRSKWDSFLKKWISSGKEVPGLIQSPALRKPPEEWAEKDIYDYGVSGVILCNRPEIVDWLVLNNFHAQNNKLILTPAGYPNYLEPLARKLFAATPDLPVWLLHDPATSREEMLRECVFPIGNVVDLGADLQSVRNLEVIRSRFPNKNPEDIPLDYIPYKTISPAVSHCLASGAILSSALAVSTLGSDTDVSFG